MPRMTEREYQEFLAKRAALVGDHSMRQEKPSKFGNRKIEAFGHKFDSKAEYTRFLTLQNRLQAREISELRVQVRFKLVDSRRKSSGQIERGVDYVADFVYQENGKTVVEDVKGFKTPDYIIKRKLMLERHGIEIQEVEK